MIASDRKQPSLFFDWKQESPAAAGGRGRQNNIAKPVIAAIERPLDDGGRVRLIDSDLGFLGLLQGKLIEQL